MRHIIMVYESHNILLTIWEQDSHVQAYEL